MLIQRKMVSLLLSVFLIVLGGCSSSKPDPSEAHDVDLSMVPIKVELNLSPEKIVVDQRVTFAAVVTQDNAPVDDAKEVMFEIVNMEDKEQKIELTGKLIGDGVYQAEGTIDKVGLYSVTSHVTARTQHSMPSKEFSVQP